MTLNYRAKLTRESFSARLSSGNDPLIAQANPGIKLPKLTIVTVVRQDGSGTTFAFTKNLDAISEKWRNQFGPATLVDWPGNVMRAKGNEGVAGLIGNSEGAIGYVGYEFARKLGLTTAALENKDGKFVKPSEESCGAALAAADDAGESTRLCFGSKGRGVVPDRDVFLDIAAQELKNAETANALRELFQWCLQDGQRYASELGYVRVPALVSEKALSALNSINSGG